MRHRAVTKANLTLHPSNNMNLDNAKALLLPDGKQDSLQSKLSLFSIRCYESLCLRCAAYGVKQGIMVLFLLLMMALTSCQKVVVGEGPWVKKIDSEEVSKLVINYAAEAKRIHHIELEDSRVEYNDFIQKIYLEFSSQRLLTVYDARLLMVEVVEEFLSRLNNHTFISYELERFPFTASDIEVKINFESFYGRYIDELYVGLAWLKCGCVYYYAFDIKDESDIDWSHDRWEPYFKSRELALLKKEADIPFLESERQAKKSSHFIGERYMPRNP